MLEPVPSAAAGLLAAAAVAPAAGAVGVTSVISDLAELESRDVSIATGGAESAAADFGLAGGVWWYEPFGKIGSTQNAKPSCI